MDYKGKREISLFFVHLIYYIILIYINYIKFNFMKALLIEDDKVITNSLISFLKEKNIILDSAIDGGLGLMMAQTINYDIIILDYNLPTLNGWEITKN